MAVEIKDLTYVYSPKSPFEKKALDRVSLTVDDGDFFGIIGHTGSGKSTLISHLNATEKPRAGRSGNRRARTRGDRKSGTGL